MKIVFFSSFLFFCFHILIVLPRAFSELFIQQTVLPGESKIEFHSVFYASAFFVLHIFSFAPKRPHVLSFRESENGLKMRAKNEAVDVGEAGDISFRSRGNPMN